MPKLLCTLVCSLCLLPCFAQKNYGVNQDYYIYRDDYNSIVPLIYYQTKNNWYASFKYNYEEEKTCAFQLGKKFSKKGMISYSATPLAGVLTGKFKGVSVGTQAEINAGKFSLYAEPEYCIQFNNTASNFFYSWSEISVQPSRFFYSGLALQSKQSKQGALYAEPGVMFGITVKNFELPLYFFKPSAHTNYFIVGIHWSLKE